MDNILISKNKNNITIFNKGNKLLIVGNDFDKLKNLSKEEIKKWYLSR